MFSFIFCIFLSFIFYSFIFKSLLIEAFLDKQISKIVFCDHKSYIWQPLSTACLIWLKLFPLRGTLQCTSTLSLYDCFVLSEENLANRKIWQENRASRRILDLDFFFLFTGPFCFPFIYPLTCIYGCSYYSWVLSITLAAIYLFIKIDKLWRLSVGGKIVRPNI